MIHSPSPNAPLSLCCAGEAAKASQLPWEDKPLAHSLRYLAKSVLLASATSPTVVPNLWDITDQSNFKEHLQHLTLIFLSFFFFYQEENYTKENKIESTPKKVQQQASICHPKISYRKLHFNIEIAERTYFQNEGPSLELNKINFIKNLPHYPDFFFPFIGRSR